MQTTELVLIAVGLSMDAFAVSITLGLSCNKPKIKEYLLPGVYFGGFQAIMPLIGYFFGKFFAEKIQSLDHWAAFILLSFIGSKMIWECFAKEKESDSVNESRFHFFQMLLLAVATSIDALVVGVTFAFFNINIFYAVLLIGLITFIFSVIGVKVGNIFGTKFKSKAEFIGGAILIALGIKILIEHLY